MQSLDFARKKCKPCEGGARPFPAKKVRQYLRQIEGWSFKKGKIGRDFMFKNYYETISFVNAVAWICHREDHHPDIEFGYKTCRVSFWTHAIGGISENDFICAAKINELPP